jgi:hypothetical protein
MHMFPETASADVGRLCRLSWVLYRGTCCSWQCSCRSHPALFVLLGTVLEWSACHCLGAQRMLYRAVLLNGSLAVQGPQHGDAVKQAKLSVLIYTREFQRFAKIIWESGHQNFTGWYFTHSEVFSGDQPWSYNPMFWNCPSSGLMLTLETVSKKLDCNSILSQLITLEDSIAFSHSESFRSYLVILSFIREIPCYRLKPQRDEVYLLLYLSAILWRHIRGSKVMLHTFLTLAAVGSECWASLWQFSS